MARPSIYNFDQLDKHEVFVYEELSDLMVKRIRTAASSYSVRTGVELTTRFKRSDGILLVTRVA